MPTYEYACTSCGEHLEVAQSFRDDALTECPACGGRLRKVFGSIGVVFKGSGFYKTDSRPSSTSGDKASSTSSDKAAASNGAESSGSSPSGSGDSNSSTGSSSTASSTSDSSGSSGGSDTGKAAAAAS